VYRYVIVFLSSFAIFLAFLTPNVNTGDAGELITASYYLGTAHPSGYPLYLLIAKAFTFLPIGNIAFKVALVSAFFSSLSLTIIFLLVFRLTSNSVSAAFAAVMLITAYSYLTQSVIAKFYPLNLFLILVIFAIWLFQIEANNSRAMPANSGIFGIGKAIYMTAFLFGLITANHHTGILMAGPVLVAMFMCRREIASSLLKKDIILNFILKVLALFFLGFCINAYLLARGGDSHFFNIFYVRNLEEFFSMVSRQSYIKGGTLGIAKGSVSNVSLFWYGFNNFISVLKTNFGIASFILFFPGCFYLFKKNRKIFIFTIISLLVYGPLCAKLFFAAKNASTMNYYVAGLQYFLPALAIYSFFIGFGFYQITLWFSVKKYKFINRLLPVTLALFFLTNLFFRYADSNYRDNYVPYQVMKDTYTIMPVNSVFLAFGDNERFQGRYLKLVGRYREDICHLNAATLQKTVRGFKGCGDFSYSSISPETFRNEFDEISRLASKNRLFSDGEGENQKSSFEVENSMDKKNYSLVYQYAPKTMDSDNRSIAGTFLNNRLPIIAKLVDSDVCIPRPTDDIFTGYLCDKYNKHFSQLISFYGSYSVKKTP
jgi:hypothetical protein